MKRPIFFLIAAFLGTTCIQSEVFVSSEEAQNVAAEYYRKVSKNSREQYEVGTPEKFSLFGKADMWLVPISGNWILVSSDKRTEAILARFTTPKKPDLKSFPPAAQYLISCYEDNISYVRDTCKDCAIRDCWGKQLTEAPKRNTPPNTLPSSVAPLLEDIAWNQSGNESWNPDCDKVYNRSCPVINTNKDNLCGHAVAGCVAVAVGQIMRYWEWPYMANVPTTSGSNTKEIHFFELGSTPSFLSNSSSVMEAILTSDFLRDCGYDMGMNYGETSLATDAAAVNTFIHFGYNPNTIHNQGDWYTSGWTNILHSEIAAGRPVYYGARTASIGGKGHTYILDGYDAYGLYHVNLGWGIYYNDYYSINSIYGYSHWQSAIWGIQPDSSRFCSPITITMPIANPNWGVMRAGTITLDGVVMNSNANCRVYSSTEVRLINGAEIRNGSYARIAIKDIPCSSISNSPSRLKTMDSIVTNNRYESLDGKEDFLITPNPAKEILYINTDLEIKRVRLYNIEGNCLINSLEKELHIAHLPTGVYLLHVETTDGMTKQAKVLHLQ